MSASATSIFKYNNHLPQLMFLNNLIVGQDSKLAQGYWNYGNNMLHRPLQSDSVLGILGDKKMCLPL